MATASRARISTIWWPIWPAWEAPDEDFLRTRGRHRGRRLCRTLDRRCPHRRAGALSAAAARGERAAELAHLRRVVQIAALLGAGSDQPPDGVAPQGGVGVPDAARRRGDVAARC